MVFSSPNAPHRSKCEQVRPDVEAAWKATTGHAVTIELITKDEPAAGRGPSPLPTDDDIDLDELVDAAAGHRHRPPSIASPRRSPAPS